MAELHEAVLVAFRKKFLRGGFKEGKSPMPTFRPDVFAEKRSKSGKILKQLTVEAEIESTLFSEHTSHQLVLMDEYIRHQHRKRIKVDGYLLVPRNKNTVALAHSLLMTLPLTTKGQIRVLAMEG